jgi:hypothetical protein
MLFKKMRNDTIVLGIISFLLETVNLCIAAIRVTVILLAIVLAIPALILFGLIVDIIERARKLWKFFKNRR